MSSDHFVALRPFSIRPHFWLIFSLYYFLPLFFVDYSPAKLVLYFLAYGAFVICYLWACRRPPILSVTRPSIHWPIAGMVATGIIASPLTASVDTFFSYSGLFLGMAYPMRLFLPLMGAMLATIVFLGLWHGYELPFLTLTGPFGALTMSMIGIAERLRLQSQLREQRSREEIQQLAMIAERERIARDLHDILGHSLSSIALKAELAEKLLSHGKTHEGQTQLSELNQIARDSLHLVRQTVSGYKHRGLSGEVMELCERLRQNNFSVTLEGEVPALNSKAETTLILALTELTTNILRHSRGDQCRLEFNLDKENLNISVTDNGQNANIHMGNGLQGICERLSDFQGDLQVATGTQSRFTIALPSTQLRAQ